MPSRGSCGNERDAAAIGPGAEPLPPEAATDRTVIPLQDEIDPFPEPPESPRRLRFDIRALRAVYLQLLVVILAVVYGQRERWGYGTIVESGIPGVFFGSVVQIIFALAFAFPVLVLVFLRDEDPREKWSWMAVPLSIVMSFVQVWALLPLVR